MTLTLAPDIETRLRTFAQNQNLDPEQFSADLLTRALEEAETELQDTLAGLDRSMEDFAAGRWITSEELDRRLEAKLNAARTQSGKSAQVR